MYDFETAPNRQGTASFKWEKMYAANPEVSEGVIPLSTADMELKAAPEIYEGLIEYLTNEPVIGYNGATPEYLEAVVDWMKRRHGWEIQPEWIVNTPGVVAAFYAAIQAFSKEDDGIIIFRPVYNPFGMAISDNHCREVNVPLIEKDGYYTIDFEAFEAAAAKPENRILLFCSPHNPVGRVWTEEELSKIAEIAIKHDLFVISDDIWFDFSTAEHKHTFLPQVNDQINERMIVCTSASKTFNLAGMHTSNIIIPNDKVRESFIEALFAYRLTSVANLGLEATRIAYTKAEPWFDEASELIQRNKILVNEFFKTHYPKIKAPITEGTYVMWLDFREVDLTNEERQDFLHKEAEIFADTGTVFGEEGSGFERINVALPTAKLEEALNRLLEALNKREN